MKALAFFAAGALLYVLHTETYAPLVISDLSGAGQRYPLPAFALSVAVLGLAGLPPLAGFMSKWQIFAAGIQTGNTVIALLVVFAALNTTLSFAYYGKLAIAVYRQQPRFGGGRPLPVAMAVPLGALSLAVIAIGMWPHLVFWLTVPAGRVLGGGP
jgi:NADH:ubiquinone oxidoreductase subunit 2 (subunit N)